MSILFLFACGQDQNNDQDNASQDKPATGDTGRYEATLVFPEDIPRIATDAGALGIDCAAANIAAIEFNFIANGRQYGPHAFACASADAPVFTAPAGTDVAVEVYADDADGNAVLEGSEVTDIRPNQLTAGGEINMEYTSPPTPTPTPTPTPEGDRFTNGFGMTFIRIPRGAFMMGSPTTEMNRGDDETQHQVTLTQDFYMQTTEVTQAQWEAVMGTNPAYFTACGPDCPADMISWEMTQQFITRLNALGEGVYALPTEAEWEYAARAGTTTALPTGDLTTTGRTHDPNLESIAWSRSNSVVNYAGCYDDSAYGGPTCLGTNPIGQKLPNAWGLFDMYGNLWEWVADWYGTYPTTAQIDPSGPSSGTYRVARGGGWISYNENCRSANRANFNARESSYYNGFRLVYRQP